MNNKLKINQILSYINIMNQCFKDLDDFGKSEKNKYNLIKCNQKKYYRKTKNLLISLLEDNEKNNLKKKCKWLHADWCHHPDDESLQKCAYYFDNYNCPQFQEKLNENGRL